MEINQTSAVADVMVGQSLLCPFPADTAAHGFAGMTKLMAKAHQPAGAAASAGAGLAATSEYRPFGRTATALNIANAPFRTWETTT